MRMFANLNHCERLESVSSNCSVKIQIIYLKRMTKTQCVPLQAKGQGHIPLLNSCQGDAAPVTRFVSTFSHPSMSCLFSLPCFPF